MTGVGPKDLIEFVASRGAAVWVVGGGATWEVCGEVKGTRTPIEGSARPLKGDTSNMPFVDDGNGGTAKTFPRRVRAAIRAGWCWIGRGPRVRSR